jgi:hypothetical protein
MMAELQWIQGLALLVIGLLDLRSREIPAWVGIGAMILFLLSLHSIDQWVASGICLLILFRLPIGIADKLLIPWMIGNYGFWMIGMGFLLTWFWTRKGQSAPLLFCCGILPFFTTLYQLLIK